jgi:geranylgeranyl pyrophosphate synthase
MIGGQAIDIESEGKEIDEDTLLQMHFGKTASLITACLEVGSLSAGYPPSPLLQSIGKDLGLAFQFQDDLLDATSTTALIGKMAGADALKEKPTAVSIYGVLKTEEKLHLLEKSIFQKLQLLPNQGSQLAIIIRMILNRKN